jgi:hypothetical protein
MAEAAGRIERALAEGFKELEALTMRLNCVLRPVEPAPAAGSGGNKLTPVSMRAPFTDKLEELGDAAYTLRARITDLLERLDV